MNRRHPLAYLSTLLVALPCLFLACASAPEGPAPADEQRPAAELLEGAEGVDTACVIYDCYDRPDPGSNVAPCGQGTSAKTSCNRRCVAECVLTDVWCQ